MPRFELEVAIALAASVPCSLLLWFITRPEEHKIQLPTHTEGDEPLAKDPFDVTKPDDLMDGYPINEEVFWAKVCVVFCSFLRRKVFTLAQMRLWKTVLAIVFAAILIIQSVCLGWSIVEEDRKDIIIYALQVFFAFYNFCVAVRSIRQINPYHTHSVTLLFALTMLTATLLITIAILPTSPVPSASMVQATTPKALWYITLALYCISAVIAITMPTGPLLHFPSERIYSEKTIQSTTTKYADNVCGVVGK